MIFDHDFEANDNNLGWLDLDLVPLVVGIGTTRHSHATRASTSTITKVADVPEEFEETKLVTDVEDPISTNSDEFDN